MEVDLSVQCADVCYSFKQCCNFGFAWNCFQKLNIEEYSTGTGPLARCLRQTGCEGNLTSSARKLVLPCNWISDEIQSINVAIGLWRIKWQIWKINSSASPAIYAAFCGCSLVHSFHKNLVPLYINSFLPRFFFVRDESIAGRCGNINGKMRNAREFGFSPEPWYHKASTPGGNLTATVFNQRQCLRKNTLTKLGVTSQRSHFIGKSWRNWMELYFVSKYKNKIIKS